MMRPCVSCHARRVVWCVMGVAAVSTACGSGTDNPYFAAPDAAGRGGSSAGAPMIAGRMGVGGNLPLAGTGGDAAGSGTSGSTSGGTAGDGSTGGSGAMAGSGIETGGVGGASGAAGMGGNAGVMTGTGGTAGAEAGSGGTAGDGGTGGGPSVSCDGYNADAKAFDGHCYLYQATAVRFEQASDDCESRGAHLVTISSSNRTREQFEAENAFVWELSEETPVWIGAFDGKTPLQPGDGTFYTWINGEPMDLDAWSSGQPNNAQTSCSENTTCSCNDGACYEHCAFIWATEGVDPTTVPGWNDRLCEHEIGFVCEWDEGS